MNRTHCVSFLKSLLVALLCLSGTQLQTLHAQEFNPYYASLVDEVSYDSLYTHLKYLEDLGIKEPGTEALNQTASWLLQKYQSYGYTNIVIDTFSLNGNELYNIVVTRYGSVFPPRFLIIDGHYDTEQGPGVNDNGSGVACILEIARLLATVPIQYSLRFINFSAEESGLVGSHHYVDETVIPTNMNILLVLNIDEIGGVAGTINNTITCERDENLPTANNAASYAYTDSLATITELYSQLQTHISYAYGSDYVPFQEAGKVITGFYETNESPYVHSPNDIMARMSPPYVFEVTKAATAAALHFSGAYFQNTSVQSSVVNHLPVFPNPAKTSVQWDQQEFHSPYELIILNRQGTELFKKTYTPEEPAKLDINHFPPGILLMRFSNQYQQFTTRIIKSL